LRSFVDTMLRIEVLYATIIRITRRCSQSPQIPAPAELSVVRHGFFTLFFRGLVLGWLSLLVSPVKISLVF
jgi:hypothetical protein